MRFEVTILGSSSALPTHGRFPTSQVLNVDEHLYLIDCGEGTQWRMLEYQIKKNKINEIFITHLHGDHVFGLIGLLTSFSLSGRIDPISIFSPKGLEDNIRVQLKYSGGNLRFPMIFQELDTTKKQLIFEDKHVEVFSFPLKHRIPTCGFLFKEKPKPLNIIPSQIERYNIPVPQIKTIKQGADLELPDGTVILNEALTFPKTEERSFAFCSDTSYDESIVPTIEGVSLLYHEATFLHENADLAKETMHSTAKQAATIAKKAGAIQLVLGHYSSRYKDLQPLLDEAREIFPNTLLGKEGMTIIVEQKTEKTRPATKK